MTNATQVYLVPVGKQCYCCASRPSVWTI